MVKRSNILYNYDINFQQSASDAYKDYLQEERQNFGSDRITAAGRKLTDHSSSTSSSTKRMQASTASVSEA